METPETIAAEYLRSGAVIDIGSTISRGWALVRDNMPVLIGATLLGWLIAIGLAFVPVMGWAVGIVLVGGLDYMFIRRMRGEEVQIGDLFAGFNIALLNLVMVGLLKWVLTSIGSCCASCPASTWRWDTSSRCRWCIDKKMDFWPAMEVSRQVVHKHWWSTFLFVIVLAIIVCAGLLVCLVGGLISVPVASAALMYAYEDLFRRRASPSQAAEAARAQGRKRSGQTAPRSRAAPCASPQRATTRAPTQQSRRRRSA